MEAARRQAAQPRRARQLGRVDQLLRQARVRPAAVHRGLGRPRRVDQPGRLRQGIWRGRGLGLVRARHQPARHGPANRDHRVHQCRPDGRPGHGQHGRRPVQGLQRLLGHVLDVRLVLIPQVRPDAPLQPARPGLRAEAGQGALDRRPCRSRDGRGLAHPLRHLRHRRDAALPRGPRDRSPSVGIQRGPRRPGRGAVNVSAHRRAAPDAAGDRAARPRGAGHAVALRGGPRRLRDARLQARPAASGGTVFVQGTMSTANLVKVLPQLDERGLNVKIVACISPQLFRMQDAAYRDATVSLADRWDGMAITNRAFKLMNDWVEGDLAARVLALIRLGRSLAHRRLARRGDRGGPSRPGAHRRGHRALRARARLTPRPPARDGRGRSVALAACGR